MQNRVTIFINPEQRIHGMVRQGEARFFCWWKHQTPSAWREDNKEPGGFRMKFLADEIAYYVLNNGSRKGEIACNDCIRDSDEITAESIVTTDTMENEEAVVFCDRCDKRIS